VPLVRNNICPFYPKILDRAPGSPLVPVSKENGLITLTVVASEP
jgi:hypothetical protein